MRVIPLPDRLDEAAARDLHRRLAGEYRIEVALPAWPGGRALRVSAQVYNRPADYDRLADAVAELTRGWLGSRAA
jgi:isopenicillin-N epimerase